LKTSRQRTTIARQLYGSSVAAARNPVLFRDWCVADTLEGRFEMVALHVGLLVRRLTADGPAGKALGQAVLEVMVTSLDDDMRELGVSDVRVSKKVQGAASAFYGRLKVYDEVLKSGDEAALEQALQRNVPGSGAGEVDVRSLARHVIKTADTLQSQSLDELSTGTIVYPSPRAAA
jgi:cytochrome b pre-mRNA-processing protein 3